jgi:hypothetical protein
MDGDVGERARVEVASNNDYAGRRWPRRPCCNRVDDNSSEGASPELLGHIGSVVTVEVLLVIAEACELACCV